MRTFAITWDYRCPFARNANEFVVDGLRGGADWDVTFLPFSLGQIHVTDGETPIWDRPDDDTGLLAPEVHRALFALRHDLGGDLRDADRLRGIVQDYDVDADAVFSYVADGRALKTVREAHDAAVADHDVWGVPTLICADRAVFVRLMHRSDGDGATAKDTVERLLDLMDGFVDLNEFKQTSIPH
jgi:hypothetical protein